MIEQHFQHNRFADGRAENLGPRPGRSSRSGRCDRVLLNRPHSSDIGTEIPVLLAGGARFTGLELADPA